MTLPRPKTGLPSVRDVSGLRMRVGMLALLAFVIFFVHFFYFQELGLYEDDYFFIATGFSANAAELWEWVIWSGTHLPQGRPLGMVLPNILAALTIPLGGLPAAYLLAFAILTLNAFLFYLLLLRVGSCTFAACGTFAYVLFPADTTDPYLMHAFGLQPSLTFLLIGSLVYLSRWRPLSYVIILGALITYESAFMPFFAVPLLELRRDRGWARRWLLHLVVLGAMLGLALVVRRLVGEERVMQELNDPLLLAARIAVSLVLGPLVSIASYGLRVATTWSELSFRLLVWMGLVFIVLGYYIWTLPRTADVQRIRFHSGWRATIQAWKIWLKANALPIHLPVAAIATLSLAYGLSFTHFPPTILAGRLTSVHLAAVFGAALLVGWLAACLIAIADSFQKRFVGVILVVSLFASLGGFAYIVQRDFRQSWIFQRDFWTSVVELAPDLEQRTVVLLEWRNMINSYYIGAHSWTDAYILSLLYEQPADWTRDPILIVVPIGWENEVEKNGDALLFDTQDLPPYQKIPLVPGNVIYLQADTEGRVFRRQDTLTVAGQPFPLKPRAPATNLTHRPLYDVLIK